MSYGSNIGFLLHSDFWLAIKELLFYIMILAQLPGSGKIQSFLKLHDYSCLYIFYFPKMLSFSLTLSLVPFALFFFEGDISHEELYQKV